MDGIQRKGGFYLRETIASTRLFLGCNKLILLVFKNSNLPKYSNMKIGLYLKNNYKWNMTAWNKKKKKTLLLNRLSKYRYERKHTHPSDCKISTF